MTDDETNGPTDRALDDLLRVERHRAQVEERRRRNGLRRQADEAVALLDVLDALAAHGAVVAVHTTAGPVPASTICDVGRDYVALRAAGPTVRLIPVAAIAAARPVAAVPVPVPTGAAHPSPTLDLGERLRELASQRASVRVIVGGEEVTGRLRGVGHDVLVVEEDHGDTFVALAALAEVAVDP